MLYKITFLIIINVYMSSAAFFMWSNHEIKISPLENFNTKNFLSIIEKYQQPNIYVFKSPKPLSGNIMDLVKGFYSIYNPNGELELKGVIDLTGNSDEDIAIIKETIGNSSNFISTILIPSSSPNRIKRELTDGDESDEDSDVTPESISTSIPYSTPAKEPVIYKACKTKGEQKLCALLYSSGPLIIRTINESDVFLGNVNDHMMIYDSRLNVIVPNGREKIVLRFNITLYRGYWYIPSVKIEDTQKKTNYTLDSTEEIVAPMKFSYHCNGETIFTDFRGLELIIYDLQVQTDSLNGKFGDAYDCVPFTTAPICSGIFITLLLGIGLVVALISIMDIKTMDKFDNHKTKNLAITVSE